MKLGVKCLALVAIITALCLATTPAFSTPAGNNSSKGDNYRFIMIRTVEQGSGQPGMGHMMGTGMMAKDGFDKGTMMNKAMNFQSKDALMNLTRVQSVLIRKSGSGFATSGDQYHELKMSMVSKATFDPAKIEKLVSDNKTLAEIKSQIKAEIFAQMDAASHNGTLTLGQDHYKLTNIKTTTSSANDTAIEADVAGPITFADMNETSEEKTQPVVGHISVATAIHDGKSVATGTITMNSGNNSGKFNVLLAMNHANKGFNRNGFKGQSHGFNGQVGLFNGRGESVLKGLSCNAASGSACKAAYV